MKHRSIAAVKQRVKRALGPIIKHHAPKRTDLPPSLWRLERGDAGVLALDDIPLPDLVERYGSPLHVVDAHKLDQNIADWLAVAPGAAHGCEIYYSYKTNPVPGVLQRMHRQGIGAEVISEYELWLALRLGVAPQHIVYNGPAKSHASLRVAIEQEIGLINFNHLEEIAPVAAIARTLGKRPRVGVRVVVPGGWSGQFGTPVAGGAALAAFREAIQHPELNVVALHAHGGYEISTTEQARRYVAQVLAFADELHARLGVNLEVIDLGGSLACATTRHFTPREVRQNQVWGSDLVPRAPESVLSIREYVALVQSLVEAHYRRAGRAVPRICLEPGRAMTANTQMLLCQVLSIKQADPLTYAVLDAGINVAEPVPNEYHQLFAVGAARSAHKEPYRLVGPICTPMDVLYHQWEMPTLAPGDALAIMDTGAYFVPFATSFSFGQPAIVMIDGGEHRVLRRAETFDDMVALDVIDQPRTYSDDTDVADEALASWISY